MISEPVAIVIPTIRNLDFLKDWKRQFADCIGIIIEDHPKKEIDSPKKYFTKLFHYCWKDIDSDFGKKSWIFPRKNAGIRSYGFFKAYQLKIQNIITLDDDCFPVKGQSFVNDHLENLSLKAPKKWFPTYPHRQFHYTRGVPYCIRDISEVVISHGLWSNILDFDAPTQLVNYKLSIPLSFNFSEFIPKGYYFPMCSMNLAFKTKISPLMYFPLMGYNDKNLHWGYDRFDDIWAGVFAKKIIDHLDLAVVNGSPFVEHKKASNVFTNLLKEAKGIQTNEILYQNVDKVTLTSKTIVGSYKELIAKLELPKEDYFIKLKKAIEIWLNLY